MLSQETMELVDPFSKPVPGQSLTNDPDNPYPWESPPEFVNVNTAIDSIVMNMLGDEEKLANIIEVLASGEIPIAGIAQIILEDGFRKGKYNPDLMLLLAEPLMVILMALAERAGIRDYEIYQGEGSELSGEEQAELANDVINSYKEEVNFRGLKTGKNIDVRSVPEEVLERIEEADIPAQPSLMERPAEQPEQPQQSLLGR
tara:strand:+ start:341 stop:946 length:606 start_codon:yes stop_codon:yes gene_type:complete